MAFYREHDLPAFLGTLRHRVAARVDYFDGAITALALLKTNSWIGNFGISPSLGMSQRHLIPEGSPAERKAKADEIAAALGSVTEWQNGYYMARHREQVFNLTIHFDPPILLADFDSDGAAEAA